MFVITGITGRVGGTAARALLAAGHPVRAVVRDPAKAQAWERQGCEIAVADHTDAAALTRAFEGAQAVFLMSPPNFDPEPGFPDSQAIAAAFEAALRATRPQRVVYLSTVGAHVAEPNLLNNASIIEAALRRLPLPVTFLRAAWFMENASGDIDAARAGTIHSFLNPLDHPIPMVATADIGRVVAELLQESWDGVRVVELEGPRRYSANDVAQAFAAALGRTVHATPVPRDTWETLLRGYGARNPMPRIRMVDGFNEGWIDFEGTSRKASTTLEAAVRAMVDNAA